MPANGKLLSIFTLLAAYDTDSHAAMLSTYM
jgi:hypothetical protein